MRASMFRKSVMGSLVPVPETRITLASGKGSFVLLSLALFINFLHYSYFRTFVALHLKNPNLTSIIMYLYDLKIHIFITLANGGRSSVSLVVNISSI